jgi:hypothetical protein
MQEKDDERELAEDLHGKDEESGEEDGGLTGIRESWLLRRP